MRRTDSYAQKVGLVAGPALAICLVLFFDLDVNHPEVTRTAAVGAAFVPRFPTPCPSHRSPAGATLHE